MTMHRALLLAGVLALAIPGCHAAGPAALPVTGTVTWNGEPIPEGDILLEAADGLSPPSHAKIKAGAFRLETTAGAKVVRVIATRETKQIDPIMKTRGREAYIPERYNAKTTLKADVAADKTNRFTFELRSEK